MDGYQGARRLARALLADPLSPEPEWEKLLLEHKEGEDDGPALLLRYDYPRVVKSDTNLFHSYGQEANYDANHPLIRRLSLPSSKLLVHNLEILIQSLHQNPLPERIHNASYLIPKLEIATSNIGRTSTILFPVHKALVYAEGLKNASSLPTIETRDGSAQSSMLKSVINENWSDLQSIAENSLSPINLTQAEAAIKSFRESLGLAAVYERAWFGSGLASVSEWFMEGLNGQDPVLKPTVRRLIENIIDNTREAVLRQEEEIKNQLECTTVPVSTRDSLDQAIIWWAEVAHAELRDQLGNAFVGRDWKKLRWWKLFWRVDDVSFIAADILQRSWLVEAEKEMIWHFGRIEQAGLLGDQAAKLSLRPKTLVDAKAGANNQTSLPSLTTKEEPISHAPTPLRLWPQEISHARFQLSATTIFPLQALSQRLIIEAISITFLTSSLSAQLYFAISNTSVYEAGAIAALGFVYSLHRLQSKWSSARETWEGNVMEEGRRILRDIEESMRGMVRNGARKVVDEREVEDRKLIVQRLERVRNALEKLD